MRICIGLVRFPVRGVTTVAASNPRASRDSKKQIPSFRKYNFLDPLYEVLDKKEIYTPTPIQQRVIPPLLDRRNLFFTGQNGTGKTLAYALPLVQMLKLSELANPESPHTQPMRPRALVVVPSRELAMQTEAVIKEFAHAAKFRVAAFYGGEKLGVEFRDLRQGLDIVVATPERLDKHRKKQLLYVNTLEHLIIDELDTLVDSGYGPSIETYVRKTAQSKVGNKGQQQIVMLSSTHPKQVDSLVEGLESKYNFAMERIIDVKTHLNLSNLDHSFEEVKDYDKMPTLKKHMRALYKPLAEGKASVIIFCNSIRCAQAVEHFLSENRFRSTSLHGDIPHIHRQHNYLQFKLGEANVLVATDLASRGLDFPSVTHVINFDFPETQSDYLHRAGRAGRAGRKGTVITFYRKRDMPVINRLTEAVRNGTPLEIKDSAFSKINKEDVKRNPTLLIEGKKKRAAVRARAQGKPTTPEDVKAKAKEKERDKDKGKPSKDGERMLNFKLRRKPKREDSGKVKKTIKRTKFGKEIRAQRKTVNKNAAKMNKKKISARARGARVPKNMTRK